MENSTAEMLQLPHSSISDSRMLELKPSLLPRHPPQLLFENPSDDDDEDDEDNDSAPIEDHPRHKKDPTISSSTPWHRMKWSDENVRLLISAVAYVGGEANHQPSKVARKALLKKGKWKAVSTLMLGKGCYVSPQQCEDKFNDLNKRYKRLNEILGQVTTCLVVENPALLESVSHVSAKGKEDIQRILSSKHLFYSELCAFHNGKMTTDTYDFDLVGLEMVEDEAEDEELVWRNEGLERFIMEIDRVFKDEKMSVGERKEWFRRRTLQLQEEREEICNQGIELEKRILRWQKFSSEKDRELEGLRLEKERLWLGNERMVMGVKQMEQDLLHGSTSAPLGYLGYGMAMGDLGKESMELDGDW